MCGNKISQVIPFSKKSDGRNILDPRIADEKGSSRGKDLLDLTELPSALAKLYAQQRKPLLQVELDAKTAVNVHGATMRSLKDPSSFMSDRAAVALLTKLLMHNYLLHAFIATHCC